MLPQKRSRATRVGPYLIGDRVQVGSFGEVKRAVHEKTRHEVAVKIVAWEKMKLMALENQLKREIEALRRLDHPRVLKAIDVFRSDKFVFLITEFMRGGDLFDYLGKTGPLPDAEAARVFAQIVDGVAYCHREGVCHRDLKLENVFVDERGDVKVADFGFCTAFASDDVQQELLLKTMCGTTNYLSPELANHERYSGTKADAWALGVILFTLIEGELPFDDDDNDRLFDRIRRGSYSVPRRATDAAFDIIRGLLCVDPERRTKVSELSSHHWIASYFDDEFAIEEGGSRTSSS